MNQLKNQIDLMAAVLKEHERTLVQKEEKLKRVKEVFTERQENERQINGFIKKVLSINEDPSLFNNPISDIRVRFS